MNEVAASPEILLEQPAALMKERNVLVFRKDLLPISETFILDQFQAYRRYQPVLVGYRRVPGVAVPSDAQTLFDPPDLANRAALKLAQHLQYIGYVPKRMAELLARTKPAIVHAHFGYDALLISDAARRAGLPLVVTLHGTDIQTAAEYWQSGAEGQFFRGYPAKLQRLMADPSVHFVAVSEALRRTAIAQGVPPERVRVVYTGVDSDAFPPIDGAPTDRRDIVFVGRLTEFKGLEFLLQAMAQVAVRRPGVRLVVVGDGPLRSPLTALAERLGVPVEFLGAAPRAVVQATLRSARALCLPSVTTAEGRYEAFGMVLLEAGASGTPVITSAQGGAESVIDGVTGFVTVERDVDMLADRIVTLCEDDGLFSAMSEAVARHVRAHFDIRTCAVALEAYYDDILLRARDR